jgi:diguanylate cyclase (GGDEF)-like protein
MGNIDIFTILVLTALNLGTVSIALPLIMGRRISPAARRAQVSMACQAMGWVCIVASDQWNGHWLDPALSTISIGFAAVANYLMFRALEHWLGRRSGRPLVVVLTVLTPVVYALTFPHYSLRVAFANFFLAAQLLVVGYAALWPRRSASLPWRALISLCYCSVAAVTVGRGVLGGFYPELYPNFQSPHPINVIAQLVANVALVLTTVAVLVAWREEADTKLRKEAYTDGLTGLLNRLGWDQRAPALFNQARRHNTPLALFMLDLDHFKRINDTMGHEVGDQVLRMFSDVLQSHRRSGDLAARVGGEEFTLLLPHTDQAAAVVIEKRLRDALKEACALQPKLTVNYSAGLAMLQRGDATLTTFMVRADDGLYLAKRLGRARLEIVG